jgi:Mycothiol maleylpyruvate isomerase N-terminal domain
MVTKEELLRREDESWASLVDAIGAVPQDRRDDPGVVPGWSVHDMVWHCGYWAGFVVDVLRKIGRGESTDDDQDWDAINETVVQEGRSMSWDDVIVSSERNRTAVREALSALPTLTDEAVAEFGGETFEHYDEHATEIRAFAGS